MYLKGVTTRFLPNDISLNSNWIQWHLISRCIVNLGYLQVCLNFVTWLISWSMGRIVQFITFRVLHICRSCSPGTRLTGEFEWNHQQWTQGRHTGRDNARWGFHHTPGAGLSECPGNFRRVEIKKGSEAIDTSKDNATSKVPVSLCLQSSSEVSSEV